MTEVDNFHPSYCNLWCADLRVWRELPGIGGLPGCTTLGQTPSYHTLGERRPPKCCPAGALPNSWLDNPVSVTAKRACLVLSDAGILYKTLSKLYTWLNETVLYFKGSSEHEEGWVGKNFCQWPRLRAVLLANTSNCLLAPVYFIG